jgi:hypothetical protein
MTNYRFEEAITTDDGERVAFPILVYELYSRPHALERVPEVENLDRFATVGSPGSAD